MNKSSLLHRLSIATLILTLITASLLIILFWQNEISNQKVIAAQNNEKILTILTRSLAGPINSLLTHNNQDSEQKQHFDLLLTSTLNRFDHSDLLKLKIYDLTGSVVYSSTRGEVGEVTMHPDFLARSLQGETVHSVEARDTFSGTHGQMQDIHVALTYMPLIYAGKRSGVIEIYDDATRIYQKLYSNITQISLIIMAAFAMLYGLLYFSIRRADRSIRSWQENTTRSELALKEAQEIAHIGSWRYDINGRITWSDESYKIFGQSPERFTLNSETFINLIH
ncbi:MAG: hypothetical protein R8K50_04645, partial [Mariprofundus sp.]